MQTDHLHADGFEHHDISKRWGDDLIQRVPRSKRAGERCLEFGCGDGRAKPLIKACGYHWVGIDIAGQGLNVQCDGHYLPFADQTFELVVTIAVFEHLYDPFHAAQELFRVLKPGGEVLGTTAFLEHFHANSYFHMTHLGVHQVFTRAGFEVQDLWPTWSFAESLSRFWVPTQLDVPYKLIASGARLAADSLMRVRTWGLRHYLERKGLPPDDISKRLQAEELAWSGAIGFRLCKP